MNKSESKYFNTATKMDLALITLLKKKPLDYITVSEICKCADVNRSTFYLHYETIGDLLDETVRYLLNDFLTYFSPDKQGISLNLKECDLTELVFVCEEYLTPYLNYIKDRRVVFETALMRNTTFGFEDLYKKMYDHIFNPILDRFHYPPNNRHYVMRYYLNGINAIVMEWLKDGCNRPIQEITEIITTCIFGLGRDYQQFI